MVGIDVYEMTKYNFLLQENYNIDRILITFGEGRY